MTAEAYLEQIGKIDTIIINKLNDYKRWVEVAEGLGGFSVGDRVQTTKNLHQIPDAIGKYIDIEREIEELKKKRLAIIGSIEVLPPNEYKILYGIYVDGKSLKELSIESDKSYGWAKVEKAKGLGNIQRMLDERK